MEEGCADGTATREQATGESELPTQDGKKECSGSAKRYLEVAVRDGRADSHEATEMGGGADVQRHGRAGRKLGGTVPAHRSPPVRWDATWWAGESRRLP